MDKSSKGTGIQSEVNNPYSIDSILQSLSWNNSDSIIAQGLENAKKTYCLKAFFQPISPIYGKDTWENCAKVICEKSDDILRYYSEDMLKWLQDLTWPGAQQIMDRLLNMKSTSMLVYNLDTLVPVLRYIGDEQWLMNIRQLLDNPNIHQHLKNDTVKILSECYDNYD